MKILRIEHVGIVVNDLDAAISFFHDFGFMLLGKVPVEGEWVERIIGLKEVKEDVAMLQSPDGQMNLELVKFYTPTDENGVQKPASNTLGIRHIAFVVEDIEATVTELKEKGTEMVGEVQTYENTYKLCYVRGPEGIIIELIEKLK